MTNLDATEEREAVQRALAEALGEAVVAVPTRENRRHLLDLIVLALVHAVRFDAA